MVKQRSETSGSETSGKVCRDQRLVVRQRSETRD